MPGPTLPLPMYTSCIAPGFARPENLTNLSLPDHQGHQARHLDPRGARTSSVLFAGVGEGIMFLDARLNERGIGREVRSDGNPRDHLGPGG